MGWLDIVNELEFNKRISIVLTFGFAFLNPKDGNIKFLTIKVEYVKSTMIWSIFQPF